METVREKTPGRWEREGREAGERTRRLRQALRRLDGLGEALHQARGSLEAARETGSRTAGPLSGIPLGRSRQSRVERAALRAADLERDIRELEAERDSLLQWIAPLVEGLEPGTRRMIVRLRLVEGMSCAAIALRLHYSRSFVYKALSEGLRIMGEAEAAGRAPETEIS